MLGPKAGRSCGDIGAPMNTSERITRTQLTIYRLILLVLGEFTKCEALDAKIAMALKRILKNTNFRRKRKKKTPQNIDFLDDGNLHT